MMEKRNFVTRARTPMEGAAEIDEILSAGAKAFGRDKKVNDTMNTLEKKASSEDEKTDKEM